MVILSCHTTKQCLFPIITTLCQRDNLEQTVWVLGHTAPEMQSRIHEKKFQTKTWNSMRMVFWYLTYYVLLFHLFFLQGAFAFEGNMIDMPTVLQAKNILNLAKAIAWNQPVKVLFEFIGDDWWVSFYFDSIQPTN